VLVSARGASGWAAAESNFRVMSETDRLDLPLPWPQDSKLFQEFGSARSRARTLAARSFERVNDGVDIWVAQPSIVQCIFKCTDVAERQKSNLTFFVP